MMMPKASSKAAAPMMLKDTIPLARYWWITANVAEGSVGEPKAPKSRAKGIAAAKPVPVGRCTKKGSTRVEPVRMARAASSASPSARNTMPRPSSRKGPIAKVPPTSNVMMAKAAFTMGSVPETKSAGTTPVIFGLSRIPATI